MGHIFSDLIISKVSFPSTICIHTHPPHSRTEVFEVFQYIMLCRYYYG